jgi:hypothetical protein
MVRTGLAQVSPIAECTYDNGNKTCTTYWSYVNANTGSANLGCFFLFNNPNVPSVNIPYSQVAVSAATDPILTPNNRVVYWDGASLKNPANCQSGNTYYLMNDGVTWSPWYINANGQLSSFGSKFFYVTKAAGFNFLYFKVPSSSADSNIATVFNGKRLKLELKCANYQGCITFFVNSTASAIPVLNFSNGTVTFNYGSSPGQFNTFNDVSNAGQPKTFYPGYQQYAFNRTMMCNNNNWVSTWFLNNSANATTPGAGGTACPVDCNGIVFGPSNGDACGICGGNNSTCKGCDGVVNSGKVNDACGICGGNGSSCLGCDGTYWSGKVVDACGVCGGTNATCKGCDGVPNSGKVNDSCGVCGGNNSCVGCDGVPNSGKKIDLCGVCGGNNSTCKDCNGVVNGTAAVDQCGVCGGNNACVGCDGVINSGKKTDACGVCGGTNQTCAGCDGIPHSNKTYDICGVCGGNGTSCSSQCSAVVTVDYVMSSNMTIKDMGGYPEHKYLFCYTVNGTKATDAIVLDFAPFKSCSLETGRGSCSNRIIENPLPGNYCASFSPGVYLNTTRWAYAESVNQQGVLTEKYCANFTFNELNSYCRDSSSKPVLTISNVDSNLQVTTYQGTFFAAVAQAKNCSDRSQCEQLSLSQTTNFTIQVGMKGTVSFNYLAQGINLQALIRSVYFVASGDVCISFETIVAHLSQNLPTVYNTTFLSNATVNSTQMTGIPFVIAQTENYCDPTFPNTESYCTQLWTICSTGGANYNDFSGVKPVQYNMYVLGVNKQQVTVNLKVTITRDVDVGQLSQNLNAYLQLYKDASFQTPYNPAIDQAFVDCNQICGLLSLDVPQQTLNCFNLTIEKVTLCSSVTQNLLPYDSENPSATGCNTPISGGGSVTKNVVYDLTQPGVQLSNYNAKFMFEKNPPYTTGQIGFCYESRAQTQFNSMVQINWHASALNNTQCTLIGYQDQAQSQDNDDNVPCDQATGMDADGHPCGPNSNQTGCPCGFCSGNSGHCLDSCGVCQGDGSSCEGQGSTDPECGGNSTTQPPSTTSPPPPSPTTAAPAPTSPVTTIPGTTVVGTTVPPSTTAPPPTSPATTSPITTAPAPPPTTTAPPDDGDCGTCDVDGSFNFTFSGNGSSFGVFFVVCKPGCVFVPGIGCTPWGHNNLVNLFDDQSWALWSSLAILLFVIILICLLLGAGFTYGPSVIRRRRGTKVIQQKVIVEEDDGHRRHGKNSQHRRKQQHQHAAHHHRNYQV